MYRKFSDRIGETKPNLIQLNSIDSALKNSLWNLIYNTIVSSGKTADNTRPRIQFIAERFLKIPKDEVPYTGYVKWLKDIYYDQLVHWWETYNLIDFMVHYPDATMRNNVSFFVARANEILEEEIAGYRFVNNQLTAITNTTEIESITNAISSTKESGLHGAETHLKTALELLSKRPNPDFRNSIKESISAVESLVRQITEDESGSFEKSLNKLESKIQFHKAFKNGISKLYGYTSDEDGIRHAILEESELDFDDAKYMLVICSGLVNFLIAKAAKYNVLPIKK